MVTIKSNDDISKAFEKGKRYSNCFATFIIVERKHNSNDKNSQHDQIGRVAFIAGKKHGNAVWRNKAKRRMREIYRGLSGSWKSNDVLFIAKSSIMNASYSKVFTTCENTLKSISSNHRTNSHD